MSLKEKIELATDAELEKMLKESTFDSPNWQQLRFEFDRRNAIKARKLKTPQHMAAWASVIAAIASILGVWLTWSQSQKADEKIQPHAAKQEQSQKK